MSAIKSFWAINYISVELKTFRDQLCPHHPSHIDPEDGDSSSPKHWFLM